jgi:hypothetical protein
MARKTGQMFIDLPFPFAGLDESSTLERQRKLTSADLLNVRGFDPRTGRNCGARRSGLTKFVEDDFPLTISGNTVISGDISVGIQEITSIPLSRDLIVASGDTLALGTAATNARRYGAAAGATQGTSSALGTVIDGCFDSDGNAYAFGVSGTTLTVAKSTWNGTSYTESWLVTRTLPVAGYNAGGCAVKNGVLYVFGGNLAASNATEARIYRFDTDDGSNLDNDYWKASDGTVNGLACPSDPDGGGTNGGLAAISGNRLGVVGFTANTAMYLQQYELDSGALVRTLITAVAGMVGSDERPYALCADTLGNFYLSWAFTSAGGDAALQKYDENGAVLWSVTATDNTMAPTGLAFDQVNGRIGAVNRNGTVLDQANSFCLINPSTGVRSSASDPSTITTWRVIAADGLGGFRIGNRAGASSRIAKLASDLSVSWSVTGLAADVLWIASTGDFIVEPVSMQSTRAIRGLVVSEGGLFRFDSSGDVETIDADFMRQSAPVVFSDQNGPFLYFVDGTRYTRYDAYDNVAETWTASAGSLPIGTTLETARLICTWRGRTVLAGLRDDPQNWFMSAIDDPTDFDYAPASPSEGDAVAGNNSPAGKVGDIINCLIPYSDDVLVFGGDHTIWQLAGDPNAGGRIDLVSDTIGMAWGRPYCKDPYGAIWFLSSRCGVYRYAPGQSLERVSQAIEDRLMDVDLANTIVRMLWDDRQQGLDLFLTPLDRTVKAIHYHFDVRNKAWFPFCFADLDHNPKAVHVFDGDDPDDRVLLMGSWDGYLRCFDADAEDDDGTDIDAYAHLGPIQGGLDGFFDFQSFEAVLQEDSADVDWRLKIDETCQEALARTSGPSGTLKAGRNRWKPARRSGRAAYLRLSGGGLWSMSRITASIFGHGTQRRKAA